MNNNNKENKEGYDFSYHQGSGVVQVPISSDDFRALKIRSDTAKTFDFSAGAGLGQLEEVVIDSSQELKTLLWPTLSPTVTCLKLSYLPHLTHLDLSTLPHLEVLSIMGCPALSKISGVGSSLRALNAYDVHVERFDLSAAKGLTVFNVRTTSHSFSIDLSDHDALVSFSLMMNQVTSKKNTVLIDLSSSKHLRSCIIETDRALAQINLTGCDNLIYKHLVCSEESVIQHAVAERDVKRDPNAAKELASLFQRDIRTIESHHDGVLTVIKQLGRTPSAGEVTLADITLVSASPSQRVTLYHPGEVAAQSVMTALEAVESREGVHAHAAPIMQTTKQAAHGHVHVGLWEHAHSHQRHNGEKLEPGEAPEQSESKAHETTEPTEPVEPSAEKEKAESAEPAEHQGELADEGFHEDDFNEAFNEEYDERLEEEEWTPEDVAWLEACRETVHEVYLDFEQLAPHDHEPLMRSTHRREAIPQRPSVLRLPQVMQRLVMLRPATPPPVFPAPLPRSEPKPRPEPSPKPKQPDPKPTLSPPRTVLVERPKAMPPKAAPMVEEHFQESADQVISKTVTQHEVRLAVIEELAPLLPEPERLAFDARTRQPQYRWDVRRYVQHFFDGWNSSYRQAKTQFDAEAQLSPERMAALGTARAQHQPTHIEHFRYFKPRLIILADILHKLDANKTLNTTQTITAKPLTDSLQSVKLDLKELVKSKLFLDFVNQGVANAKHYSLDENGDLLTNQGDEVSHYYRTTLEQDARFQEDCRALEQDKGFAKLFANPALTEEGRLFLKLLAVLLTTKTPPRLAVFVRPERFNRDKRQFKRDGS